MHKYQGSPRKLKLARALSAPLGRIGLRLLKMTSTQFVETSVTTSNCPSQDYIRNPDNQPTADIDSLELRPFTVLKLKGCFKRISYVMRKRYVQSFKIRFSVRVRSFDSLPEKDSWKKLEILFDRLVIPIPENLKCLLSFLPWSRKVGKIQKNDITRAFF